MKNVITDRSKWKESNLIQKGHIDNSCNFGFPLLSKVFFNMKCKHTDEVKDYKEIYIKYISSWIIIKYFMLKILKNYHLIKQYF